MDIKYSFLANSSWYINNFRKNTIDTFSKYGEVCVISPIDTKLTVIAKHSPIKLSTTSTSPVKELVSLLSIYSNIKSSKTSVVFSFNPKTNLYGLISCYILNIPIVVNVSGVGTASELSGLVGFLYKRLLKFLMRSANHIFFQNETDFIFFKESGFIGDAPATVLPGSGVDLNKFKYNPTSSRTNAFIVAARLIKQKGVVEYMHAASGILGTFSNIKFKLAGVHDGSNRAVSKELIEKYNNMDGFDYIGMRNDMNRVLMDVDCVVLPSYYPEGTPRSLLEAAAAGKVIITTDTPGCRDVVIEGVNGFLVPPRDTEALKEAMEKVINLSDEKLAEMQANSRKLAEEKFDEQYVIQRYLDVAEEILAKKSKK
ncbi:glycosyltransferase family 4 protein [Cobetia marina]|uniref:glycosyltransferase family 4 protein n=1 Tax=Cobetia marina TaxID=28258 RepID=UPI003857BD35